MLSLSVNPLWDLVHHRYQLACRARCCLLLQSDVEAFSGLTPLIVAMQSASTARGQLLNFLVEQDADCVNASSFVRFAVVSAVMLPCARATCHRVLAAGREVPALVCQRC
jgi:hypothetical protein